MSQSLSRPSAVAAGGPPKATVYVDFPGGASSFVDVLNTTTPQGAPRLTPATFTLATPAPTAIMQDPTTGNFVVTDKVTIEFQIATGYGFRPAGGTFRQIGRAHV